MSRRLKERAYTYWWFQLIKSQKEEFSELIALLQVLDISTNLDKKTKKAKAC
jgi:uncharacterized protein YjgD (DUF1641 family)